MEIVFDAEYIYIISEKIFVQNIIIFYFLGNLNNFYTYNGYTYLLHF